MSFYESDNLGFFETIQVCFTELTRRSIFLSGRDLEQLDQWRRLGASEKAICKGLRDAVESMPDGDPPRDVYACRHYIEPYIERQRERRVGGHAPDDDAAEPKDSEPSGLVERALAKIEDAGRQVDDEPLKEIYRSAWRRVRELTDAPTEKRFDELAAVEEGLVEGYYRALDRNERARIEERIDSDSGELLDGMSPEARREHIRAQRRRILIDEFDLVSLFD